MPDDIRATAEPGPLVNEASSSGQPPKPEVTIDWQEYFKQFCIAHGESPLVFGGRLLFADGWTYSAHDYAGPEWSPPPRPLDLCRIQRLYWMRRKAIVQRELEDLAIHIERLEEMQRQRKVPLQQAIKWFDSENRRWKKDIGPLDLTAMKGRLAWLREDVVECDTNLVSLDQQLKELAPC